MTTATTQRQATLMGGAGAPRVVLVAVVLLLVVLLTPSGSPIVQGAHVGGAIAFCAWVWAPPRARQLTGPGLGLVLLLGSAATVGTEIDVLTITGTTALLRSLRPRWGLVALAVVVTAVVARRSIAGGDLVEIATFGPQALVVIFLLVLLDGTASATRQLVATTHAFASEQVDQERARLSGQLRSLIGRTLATARDAIRDAATAADPVDTSVADQLRALEQLVDDGIAQLEQLIVEPVADSLEAELDTAQEVCDRLGIALTMTVEEVADRRIADAAALVLREAVTNMLKHAEARRCVIVVRDSPEETVLAITNDGVSPAPGSPPAPGSGQRRWRAVLDDLGAELSTDALDDDRYRVLVRFPHRSES